MLLRGVCGLESMRGTLRKCTQPGDEVKRGFPVKLTLKPIMLVQGAPTLSVMEPWKSPLCSSLSFSYNLFAVLIGRRKMNGTISCFWRFNRLKDCKLFDEKSHIGALGIIRDFRVTWC